MQVAHPASAVSLWSIPNILLHAKVCGIGADVPDAGEQRIRTIEGAEILHRVIVHVQSDRADGSPRGWTREKGHDGIAEGAVNAMAGLSRSDGQFLDASVGPIGGFVLRFAVSQIDGDRFSRSVCEVNSAGGLLPKIKRERGRVRLHGACD